MEDTVGALVLVLLFALACVALLLLARPSAIERRGRNAWVGIRIPSTMASHEAWAVGHRAAWPAMRNGSLLGLLLVLAAGVLAVAVPSAGAVAAYVSIGASLVLLVFALWAARSAHRAAERVTRESPAGQHRQG